MFRCSLQVLQYQDGNHSGPYLNHYCIGTGSDECLDLEHLFDVFEEDFYVPSGLKQLRDGFCCPRHLIGQESQPSVVVFIPDSDQP